MTQKKIQEFTRLLYEGISSENLSDILHNRLTIRYPDILEKYGYDAVDNAVSDVASFHAGAEELGTSDVGIMLKQILKQLESSGLDEDWQKVNKSDKTDGMSKKAVSAYRRENPGSKLKTAVTTKPSKLKAGSKDANRRKSFCARMSGMKGPMKDEKGRPTAKAKALSRWNCNESVEEGSDISGLLAASQLNKSFIITAQTAEGQTKKFRVHAQSERVAKEKFSRHAAMSKILSVKEEGVSESETFDPNYQYSDDYSVWKRNQDIVDRQRKSNPPTPKTRKYPEGSREDIEDRLASSKASLARLDPDIEANRILIADYKYVIANLERALADMNNVSEDSDPCWDNYKQIGMKTKNGKKVPNCVPKESVVEGTDPQAQAMAGLQRTIDFAKGHGYKILRSPAGKVMKFINKDIDHILVARVDYDKFTGSINVNFEDFATGVSGNDDASYFDNTFKAAYKEAYELAQAQSDHDLYEQGVAEGLSDTQKKIEDTILKLEQRLKFAKTPEQWDNIKNRIDRLQAGLNRSKQGVAEGFDSAAFDRHMDKLRAQKELEKTDPMRAMVNKMKSDYDYQEKSKSKSKQDDERQITDPFHPSQGVNIGEQGVTEGSLEEYGDTKKGQKILTKVHKRAVGRAIKAADQGDAQSAKKNQDTANRAWERFGPSFGGGVAEAKFEYKPYLSSDITDPEEYKRWRDQREIESVFGDTPQHIRRARGGMYKKSIATPRQWKMLFDLTDDQGRFLPRMSKGHAAGVADKKAGKDINSNPFTPGSDEHKDWVGGWKSINETNDYFRRREREEGIISGQKPARKKQPAQTSDYANRREKENKKSSIGQGIEEGQHQLQSTQLDELSTEKLSQYKKAASADATMADRRGDFNRGNKRFSGIVKATNKQFANDMKKDVKESSILSGLNKAIKG